LRHKFSLVTVVEFRIVDSWFNYLHMYN